MKIAQVYNGYANAEVYGVLVAFELDGKRFGSYFDFNRKTGDLIDVEFYGPQSSVIDIPEGADKAELEKTARAYIGGAFVNAQPAAASV